MNATQKPSFNADLHVIRVLAELLDRLDSSKVPVDAGQYRAVVQRLADALGLVQTGLALGPLLDTHPAAAELYENIQYAHAGLCRSPLSLSLLTERSAKEAIERAMHPSLQG
ncbi:MAG TPA: hypothetical protein VLJ57_21510 [Burkholderiaceae bacterium]|nr:hypothetical protein [Burkholderiaceae bacterium]